MWQVTPARNKDRGGFQDRDVGRTMFDRDFGPDFGVDFARFADPPNISKDLELRSTLEKYLERYPQLHCEGILVRNGFVFLKGVVSNEEERESIGKTLKLLTGVREVVNLLRVEKS